MVIDTLGNIIKINDPVLYVVEDDKEADAYIAIVIDINEQTKILKLSMCDSISTLIDAPSTKCVKLDINKKLEDGYLIQFIDQNNNHYYIGRGSDKTSRCIELLTVFKTARSAQGAWRGLLSKSNHLKEFDPIITTLHEARRRLFIRRRRPELINLNKKLRSINSSNQTLDKLAYNSIITLIGEIEITLAKQI